MDISERQDNGVHLQSITVKDHNGEDNLGYKQEVEDKTTRLEVNSPVYLDDVSVNIGRDEDVPKLNGYVTEDRKNDKDLVLKKKSFDPSTANVIARCVMGSHGRLESCMTLHKRAFWAVFGIILLIAYFAYFGYAMYYQFGDEGSVRLLVCTVIGAAMLFYSLVGQRICARPSRRLHKFLNNDNYIKVRRVIRWILYIISTIAMVTLIIVVVALDSPRNLLSLAGLAAFIVLCFATSHSPAMIDWHPVFWGFSIQFYFAIIILKTRWGFETFNWLGDRVTEFLAYSNAGAAFVFGDYAKITPFQGPPIEFTGVYTLHFFAFAIMPVITFFSTVISVLYYLGIMQSIIKVIGRFLSFCLGTTPAESLNAAANIFVSMTESPLMIRPFLANMTSSELHAVMVGGFATIAGSVLGAYIGFGVPADHLLSASVMSAPAALAISKITYPEIEVPVIRPEDYDKIEKTGEGNVIEAACNGATMSAKIIACVVVNVMAFLSLLKFVNATLTWFGDRVGVKNLTFELICSYVLYPVALFMGTEPEDCRRLAELVGIKTFTNEFIAYEKLSVLIKNRQKYNTYVMDYGANYTHMDGEDLVLDKLNGTRLINGIISHRSEIIATYALCGFSNIGSMGILLGSLSAMAPTRKPTMSKIIFRAMIAGNVACFFTACIAGLFFQEFD
ncbi:unnamed protein product [Lymnaea stagnalis]|uniref:Sodium/nucleoside cotransporter n=1 Tax=Lymnaea stagnalis TaxID=6523 RepID=A0AAV2GZM6_LYMST